jgi:hypothetical protein
MNAQFEIDRLRNLLDTRDRIYAKSNRYFVPYLNKREAQQQRWFHGAMDALLDASQAASSYSRAIGSNGGSNLLACYGFLQALYVQQDAVWNLSKALGLDWKPHDEEPLRYIRQLRNRLCGHPASADRQENKLRPSSAIIPPHDINEYGFKGAIYYDDCFETVAVSVEALLQENEVLLAAQLLKVEGEMDRIERTFRCKQSSRPLGNHFAGNFSYLIQRLWCDLSDEFRVIQARAHAEMIREVVVGLKTDLQSRALSHVVRDEEFEKILIGLEMLEEKLRGASGSRAQHEFEVVFAGVKLHTDDLQKRILDLDEEFRIEP